MFTIINKETKEIVTGDFYIGQNGKVYEYASTYNDGYHCTMDMVMRDDLIAVLGEFE